MSALIIPFVLRHTTGRTIPIPRGAVKLHTLLNFRTLLPEYVQITDGKTADNTAAKQVEVKPGSIVVSDRGYFDTLLLNFWDSIKVFFMVRVKDNLLYERIEEWEFLITTIRKYSLMRL